jgi:hypothetical protein
LADAADDIVHVGPLQRVDEEQFVVAVDRVGRNQVSKLSKSGNPAARYGTMRRNSLGQMTSCSKTPRLAMVAGPSESAVERGHSPTGG